MLYLDLGFSWGLTQRLPKLIGNMKKQRTSGMPRLFLESMQDLGIAIDSFPLDEQ